MSDTERLQTGIPELDQLLGGGLIPGKLTVVMGATGIGKTQLGLQFAHRGKTQEGETGVIFDMTTRGDSQNHRDYAGRLFNWQLSEASTTEKIIPRRSGSESRPGLITYISFAAAADESPSATSNKTTGENGKSSFPENW